MSEITNESRFNQGPVPTLAHQKPAMDKNVMGMICFLSSEAVFFLLLILAYVYYQGQVAPKDDPNWPTARNSLEAGKTAIFTVFLLVSSLWIWFSERALHKGKKGQSLFWLGLTIAFGAVFIVGQVLEYITLLGEKNVTISRNLFGTTFFTMTGFHGMHVTAGLIALSIVFIMMAFGAIKGNRSSALATISLYWHFVDVVWIIIFSLVYLPLLFA